MHPGTLLFVGLVVGLLFGVVFGFMLGFSRSMREAALKLQGRKRSKAPILLIIGSCLGLIVALGMTAYTWHFTRVAQHAAGTVIEMREQKDKEGGISHAPTFRFQDSAGGQHIVSSGMYQEPPAFHVGDTVGVLYLPNDPQTASIDTFGQVWGLPVLFGIVAAISLAAGLIWISWPRIVARFGGKTAYAPAT
jgi:hypothetical protein